MSTENDNGKIFAKLHVFKQSNSDFDDSEDGKEAYKTSDSQDLHKAKFLNKPMSYADKVVNDICEKTAQKTRKNK